MAAGHALNVKLHIACSNRPRPCAPHWRRMLAMHRAPPPFGAALWSCRSLCCSHTHTHTQASRTACVPSSAQQRMSARFHRKRYVHKAQVKHSTSNRASQKALEQLQGNMQLQTAPGNDNTACQSTKQLAAAAMDGCCWPCQHSRELCNAL